MLLCLLLSGISAINAQEAPLKVVATYSILGDLVQNVAGDNIELTVLVGPDGDSHTYEPTPQDVVTLSEADLIFENGLEFETWLDDLYEASGSTAQRIVVSAGIEPLAFAGHDHDHEHEGEDADHDHGHEHEHGDASDLSVWAGEWVSTSAYDADAFQPAFDAILASTPELNADTVRTYFDEGYRTSFDTFLVEGETVTLTSDAGSAACDYAYTGTTPVLQVAGEVWSVFETGDESCAEYRYLLLSPPHAVEAGASLHFHMIYGSTSPEEIAESSGIWVPALYPAGTDAGALVNMWVANARLLGVYIAGVNGIEAVMTEAEQAALASATGGEAHDHEHEDDHAHVDITDLTPWDGEAISVWALDESQIQPALDAILTSTPELTAENVLTYLEEGNYTSFDTLAVEGQSVTFTSNAGSATCAYVYVGSEPVVEFPTATWSLFATSDETCADYRYLLLMPPHAAEAGSIPHYHMRYGAADLDGLIAQGAPWYPSLYPADSDPAAIMNSWVVNARMIGLYIATAYGIDVALTEEELAAQEAAAAAPVIDVALAPRRLLVADGVESTVSVVDLASGDVLATYELSAAATVYTSPSGRYGFAVQSDGNVVNVIDSGVELEAHGDHYHTHVEAPALLGFSVAGPTPIHFVIHEGQVVVFTDDDGVASLFSEANIVNASAPLLSFASEAPHHGVGVALGDVVLLSHFDPNGEGLPNGIDVLDLDGNLLQAFGDCDQLHGEAPLHNGAAFACEQGVLVIERDGDSFTSRLIPYPGDGRAWGLAHDERSPYLFGDYGDTALVRVDVAAGTSEFIGFSEAVWEFKFHPDDASKLLVLTIDGSLHVIDAASGADEGSTRVVDAFTLPEEWSDPRPALVTIPGHALVSDPTQGVVHVVHLDGLEVEGSYDVGGTPVGLTAFGFAPVQANHDHDEHEHEEDEHGHHHGEFDPHIWHDPNNAVVMVENIRAALVAADAANAAEYEANAAAYIGQLQELDAYIREQVATIPEANRLLFTSHDTFGYFGDEYGFAIDSAIESVSTETADPSAGEIAALITEIQESGVPAIFAENITNPALIEQIAREAGVTVAPTLYTDALGQPGTPGETYLSMMRYNVETIVAALSGQS